MSKIDLEMTAGLTTEAATVENVDESLLADIGDDLTGWVVAELPYMRADGFRDNSSLQAVYNAEVGRAGLVVVGSGSSGYTEWTDAGSIADAFERFVTDNMAP